MRIVVVAFVALAFAAVVGGASGKTDRPASDRPSVVLCISAQSYESGRLSTVARTGPACPSLAPRP